MIGQVGRTGSVQLRLLRPVLDKWTRTVCMAASALVVLSLVLRWSPDVEATEASVQAQRLPSEPLSLVGAEVDGAPTARVVLIEFADFQCPFCARYSNANSSLLQSEYIRRGSLQRAFRHFPIQEVHPRAFQASEGAECAGRQGRFWGMHDLLFSEPEDLTVAGLMTKAQALRLDMSMFATCLSGKATQAVRSDYSEGLALGITGTPTFVIGRILDEKSAREMERFSGAIPWSALKIKLDRAIAVASTVPAR